MLELGEYNIIVNKKPHKVSLPNLGKKKAFRVKINGRATEVQWSGNISYNRQSFIKVGGKLYRVELDRHEISGTIVVKVDGAPYSAKLENKNRIVSQAMKPTLPAFERRLVKTRVLDKGVITASMPGKVVLLRVNAGQTVRVGDVLLVLESMKMENEIASPISGIVKEVKISEGAAVNIGEIMVVLNET